MLGRLAEHPTSHVRSLGRASQTHSSPIIERTPLVSVLVLWCDCTGLVLSTCGNVEADTTTTTTATVVVAGQVSGRPPFTPLESLNKQMSHPVFFFMFVYEVYVNQRWNQARTPLDCDCLFLPSDRSSCFCDNSAHAAVVLFLFPSPPFQFSC